MSQIRRRMAETMNYVPRNARYASQFTLHENEIQSTKDYVRIYKRIMQNKPNVKDAQINVNSYMKNKYEILDTWLSGKNKPNFQNAKKWT